MGFFKFLLLALSLSTCNGQYFWDVGADYGGAGAPFYGMFMPDYWYGGSGYQSVRQDYDVELEGGLLPSEGRVVLVKNGAKGTICDYGWEKEEADVVCKQLGYHKGGESILHSGYGPSIHELWISYTNCRHNEANLNDCEFSGMYARDRVFCNNRHEAGVKCYPNDPPPITANSQEPATSPKSPPTHSLPEIKLVDGISAKQGKIMLLSADKKTYKGICAERFTVKEGIVACKQLNEKWYAKRVYSEEYYQVDDISTVTCRSDEDKLGDCAVVDVEDCTTLAAVECSEYAPDLELDLNELTRTIGLRTSPMRSIQCAVEEKCLAETALGNYTNPYHMRQMVRFSAFVRNVGTADFRPPGDPNNWEWHECHKHYHSIAEFAYYDVISVDGKRRVESGHKVSYCLRDSECQKGARPKYSCKQFQRNGATQGISVNCGDRYGAELDCQWVDITDVGTGEYYLEIRLNPHKLVAEKRYENNFYQCKFFYNKGYGTIVNRGCKIGEEDHSNLATTRLPPVMSTFAPTRRPSFQPPGFHQPNMFPPVPMY